MSGKRRRPAPAVYNLRLELLETEPVIWREVAVPADISLTKLHYVIQVVFGWTDSHLHEFVSARGTRYQSKHPMLYPENQAKDEEGRKLQILLKQQGDTLLYRYDFGDDWQVHIELIGITDADVRMASPVCLGGELAGPPDDCGGVWGYYELLEAIANPQHEDHEHMLNWIGPGFDPAAFDRDAVNGVLARLT